MSLVELWISSERPGAPACAREPGEFAQAPATDSRRWLAAQEAVRVAAAEVVAGEELVLAEVDAVAADGRVVESALVTVSGGSLTGESEALLEPAVPVEATASLGERLGMAFSGTALARGRGRAIVTARGMETETGDVAQLLERTEAARKLARRPRRSGR